MFFEIYYPFLLQPDGAGGFAYVYQYKDHLGNVRLSYLAETTLTFEFAAEHTKRRGSKKRTNDKHTKPRSGRSNTKQRQKPNWNPNPNKRNQIVPIIPMLDEDN